MNYFKIVVAYDGTNYHGWQIQPDQESVASQMQKSFYNTFKTEVVLVGASRTDAGVHALGQVVRCQTKLNIDLSIIMQAWNNNLPCDITIRSIEPVERENFYPLRNVEYKIYYYHLFLKRPLPFIARYGWYWKFIREVDVNKFAQALKLFEGAHNFLSFARIEDDRSSTKTIDSISVKKIDKLAALRITIKGQSFLHFQIRRMIGAALDVARKKDVPLIHIKNMLDYPQAQQEYVKAESCGLCLKKIVYKKS